MAANWACFTLLDSRYFALEKFGVSPARPIPATVRFAFDNGRMGEVRFAGGLLSRIAGGRGKFVDFSMGADTSALSRGGASESPGGQ